MDQATLKFGQFPSRLREGLGEGMTGLTGVAHEARSGPPLAPPASGRGIRLALLGIWLVIVAYLAAHHVFWRDEVRAFSLALTGDNVVEMAKAVHGEGHPLLWYLLLRAAHAVAPVREVLPAVGLVVGVAGAGFFAWRAPFRWPMLAAVLFGGWMTFEYSVMARNYGISMLLMFVIADRFARGRDGALATGALLFLLCSTNVPSVIVAGGFLLFWLIEIVTTHGWRPSAALGRWAGAAAIMLAGTVACFLTVYPPFNDAAVSSTAATPMSVIAATLNVGGPFSYLLPEAAWGVPGAAALLSLLVLAGPLGLLRSPGATIAGIVVLVMTALFFQFVYAGNYRHQALFLAFVVSLRWMVAGGRGGAWRGELALAKGRLPDIASTLFSVLLAAQVVTTASIVAQVALGRVEGQTASLATLLRQPALAHAIVVAVPEVAVEPLRYYATNPTYLLRQRRFGAVTHFTRASDLHLTLGGILASTRRLQAATGRPVVILMQYPLARDTGEQWWDEGILGDVHVRPGDAAAFIGATRSLASPVTLIQHGRFDENYTVYLLKSARS